MTVETSIRDIGDKVDQYESLLQGQWPYDASSLSPYQKNKLKNLTVNFKHTAVLPLLICALQLREKKFYQIIFMLEKFFFIFRVALNKRMTAVIRVYHEEIININDNPNAYQVVWLLRKLTKIIEDNVTSSEIDAYIDKLAYAEDGDTRSLKFIFTSFEENSRWLESSGRSYKYMYRHAFKGLDKSSHLFSLEHLYPKNAKINEIDNDLEPVKHKIANLTLLYAQDNSDFKDDKFNDKKHEYAHCRLNMTRPLALLPSWDLNEYYKRDEVIRRHFKKLFSFGVIAN